MFFSLSTSALRAVAFDRGTDRLLTLLAGLLLLAGSTPARASIEFEIPDFSVASGGVSGEFDVVLRFSGGSSAPSISSFNVDFLATGPHSHLISFGTPTHPTSSPLFADDTNFMDFSIPSQNRVRFSNDVAVAVPAFDGAVLGTVPFTTSAGFNGSIELEFMALSNEITDASATPLAMFTLSSGSVTSSGAVPEPNTFLVWIAMVLGVCVLRFRSSLRGKHLDLIAP